MIDIYFDGKEPGLKWWETAIMWIFLTLFTFFVLYTIVWLLSGLRSDTHCTDTQKVVEVQATGHKHSTDYYVRGDKGGVVQSDAITSVGAAYCFQKSTNNYYRFRNYFNPRENN